MLPELNCRGFLKCLLVASAAAMAPFTVLVEPAEAANAMAVAAVKEALRGNFTDAGSFAERSGDEAAIKLVELLYLKDHGKALAFSAFVIFKPQRQNGPCQTP